jgi:predicted translin family RNA/ssDNA-binding protein
MATTKKKEFIKDGKKPFLPKETRTTAGVLILTYGANSNYRKWSQELSDHMLTIYKFHSNFTVTDTYPTYPAIRAPTNQQLVNDHLNQKRDEYLELCKQRLKNISNLEKDRYAMFAEIFKHLSETSKDKVKSHADYDAAVTDNRNPHLLWKTVRTVHTIQATGDPIGERNLQRLKLQKMRQSNTESLISFKVRMEEIYTSLQNLEHPVEAEEQVQEFLNRMDQSRFGTYLLQLRPHISLMH